MYKLIILINAIICGVLLILFITKIPYLKRKLSFNKDYKIDFYLAIGFSIKALTNLFIEDSSKFFIIIDFSLVYLYFKDYIYKKDLYLKNNTYE